MQHNQRAGKGKSDG